MANMKSYMSLIYTGNINKD